MSIKISSFILVLFIFLSGCKNGQEPNQFDSFSVRENTFSLVSKKYEFDKIYSPKRIELKNGMLIIIEDKSIPLDFPIIHLVQSSTMEYIFSKGVNGYGPFEITDAHLFDSGFNDSTFWVNSTISKKMVEFSMYDSLQLAINELRQPADMYVAYNSVFGNDSTFLSLVANDENRLVEYNFDGKKIAGYGKWEAIENRENLSYFQLSGVNTGWLKSRNDHKYFAKASLYRDRIEILNYENKEYVVLDGPRLEIPHFEIAGSGPNAPAIYPQSTKYGHRDVSLGDAYIYSLYGGGNYEDYVKTAFIAQTIYTISYDGRVIAKFELDKSLRAFVVDEKNHKIFGVTSDENPGIAVFDLPVLETR